MIKQYLRAFIRSFNRHRSKLTQVAVFLGIFLIVILPIVLIQRHDSGSLNRTLLVKGSMSSPQLVVRIEVMSLDVSSRKAEILVQGEPQAELKLPNSNQLSMGIRLDMMYSVRNFRLGSSMDPYIVTVPVLRGSLVDYPFDRFSIGLPIEASWIKSNSTNSTNGALQINDANNLEAIPNISVMFISHTANHQTKFKSGEAADPNAANKSLQSVLEFTRSTSTILMVIWLTCTMWALALTYGWWVIVISKRRSASSSASDNPHPINHFTMGVLGIGLILGLRYCMPDVPNANCTVDVLGFFWTMILMVGLTLTSVVKHKPRSFINHTTNNNLPYNPQLTNLSNRFDKCYQNYNFNNFGKEPPQKPKFHQFMDSKKQSIMQSSDSTTSTSTLGWNSKFNFHQYSTNNSNPLSNPILVYQDPFTAATHNNPHMFSTFNTNQTNGETVNKSHHQIINSTHPLPIQSESSCCHQLLTNRENLALSNNGNGGDSTAPTINNGLRVVGSPFAYSTSNDTLNNNSAENTTAAYNIYI